MSGGHFDYAQHRITDIADAINDVIESNDDLSLDEWGGKIGRGYSTEVIARFREAVQALRLAQVYAQRIDWLLSGDDGPEQFLQRLKAELPDDGITHLDAKTAADMLDNPGQPNQALVDLLKLK